MKILLTILMMISISQATQGTWQTDIQKTHNQLSSAYVEQARMCSIVFKKVRTYQETMREDDMAQVTLTHYIEQVHKYCTTGQMK